MEETLKPNDKRAKTTILFLKIMLGMSIAWGVSHYLQYMALMPLMYGNEVSEDYFYLYVAYVSPFKGIFRIVFFTTIVIYLCWFYRAYNNLRIRRKQPLKYNELWSVVGWVVPPFFLFRPYEMMKELFDLTSGFAAMQIQGYTPLGNKRIVGWWWGLWLSTCISGIVYFFVSEYLYTSVNIEMNCVVGIVTAVLMIPAAFMSIKVVKAYSALELDLIESESKKSLNIPNARVATDEQSAPGSSK